MWRLYDTFSRGGAWVNGKNAAGNGAPVRSGDTIKLSGKELVFEDISAAKRAQLEAGRTPAGRNVGPGLTLFGLTVFQAFLLLEHTVTASAEYAASIILGFLALILIEWFCYFAMASSGVMPKGSETDGMRTPSGRAIFYVMTELFCIFPPQIYCQAQGSCTDRSHKQIHEPMKLPYWFCRDAPAHS